MTSVAEIRGRVAALKEMAPRTADRLPQLSNAETEYLLDLLDAAQLRSTNDTGVKHGT